MVRSRTRSHCIYWRNRTELTWPIKRGYPGRHVWQTTRVNSIASWLTFPAGGSRTPTRSINEKCQEQFRLSFCGSYGISFLMPQSHRRIDSTPAQHWQILGFWGYRDLLLGLLLVTVRSGVTRVVATGYVFPTIHIQGRTFLWNSLPYYQDIKYFIQHLRGSLSFDWTIVGHMIFNRWYIARSCIFGYMRRVFLVICRLRTSLLHVRVSLRVSDAKAICRRCHTEKSLTHLE